MFIMSIHSLFSRRHGHSLPDLSLTNHSHLPDLSLTNHGQPLDSQHERAFLTATADDVSIYMNLLDCGSDVVCVLVK